jgi:hypothetical protein
MSSSPEAKHPVVGPSNRYHSDLDISIAEAEARYHGERLALYRAQVQSGKPTSLGRLRELERRAASADAWARRVRGS